MQAAVTATEQLSLQDSSAFCGKMKEKLPLASQREAHCVSHHRLSHSFICFLFLPLCQEPGPLVAPFFGSGGQQVARDEKFSAENDSGDEEEEEEVEEEEEEDGEEGGSRRKSQKGKGGKVTNEEHDGGSGSWS